MRAGRRKLLCQFSLPPPTHTPTPPPPLSLGFLFSFSFLGVYGIHVFRSHLLDAFCNMFSHDISFVRNHIVVLESSLQFSKQIQMSMIDIQNRARQNIQNDMCVHRDSDQTARTFAVRMKQRWLPIEHTDKTSLGAFVIFKIVQCPPGSTDSSLMISLMQNYSWKARQI